MADKKIVEDKVEEADEIKQLKAQLEEVQRLLVKQMAGKVVIKDGNERVVRKDRIAKGGWMVKTPEVKYGGVTEGVQFAEGMALVDEEMPGADEKVHRLEHDHGYEVKAMTGSEIADLRKLLAMRQNSRSGSDRTLLEKMAVRGG